MTIAKSRLLEVAQVGVIAGLAGGLAEVAWITIYGAISGVSVDIVAEEITRSIAPHASSSSVCGILIHLTLAVSLGMAVAFAIRLLLRGYGRVYAEFSLVILTLTTVWGVNFFSSCPILILASWIFCRTA